MRFEQIYEWLSDNKPKVIVEIGTWNGKNALNMMRSAKAEKYVGFDIWEEGTEDLDEIEFNAKKRVPQKDVEDLFEDKFEYELVKGNTRSSLEEYCQDKKPFADFVLIDGGHSSPTIANDFHWAIQMAKSDGVIFLDDYYFGLPQNLGSNGPLSQLNAPYTVLPGADPVFVDKKKKGIVKLVRVNMKDLQIADRWNIEEDKAWTFNPSSQSG